MRARVSLFQTIFVIVCSFIITDKIKRSYPNVGIVPLAWGKHNLNEERNWGPTIYSKSQEEQKQNHLANTEMAK